jgi:hypothetical protein
MAERKPTTARGYHPLARVGHFPLDQGPYRKAVVANRTKPLQDILAEYDQVLAAWRESDNTVKFIRIQNRNRRRNHRTWTPVECSGLAEAEALFDQAEALRQQRR